MADMYTKTYLITLQVTVQLTEDGPSPTEAKSAIAARVATVECPAGMRILTTYMPTVACLGSKTTSSHIDPNPCVDTSCLNRR